MRSVLDEGRRAVSVSGAIGCLCPQVLMEVTAGKPVIEERLKGRLNRFGVFALVRGQVFPGDE
jgi:hypothetical protein